MTLPPGKFKVWVPHSIIPGLPPKDAVETSSGKVTLKDSGTQAAALNEATHLMAFKQAVDGKVSFKKEDFSRVPEVDLKFPSSQFSGTASVTLSASGYQNKTLVSEGQDKVAVFNAVPVGKANLELDVTGKSSAESSAVLEIKADPSGTLTLTDPAVLKMGSDEGAAGAAKAGSQPSSGGKKKASWLAKGVQLLLGIVIVLAVIYGLYALFTKDPKGISDRLRSLGAPIPQDPADAQAQINGQLMGAPDPVKPAQPTPIVLSDAQVTPISVAGGSVVPPPVSVTPNPRLTMENGTEIPMQGETMRVGREPGLEVSLPGESTVSREHASLSLRDGGLYVTDTGSTNGTFVNGRKIDSETAVQPGDIIQFGSVKMRFDP